MAHTTRKVGDRVRIQYAPNGDDGPMTVMDGEIVTVHRKRKDYTVQVGPLKFIVLDSHIVGSGS
jgi:hypothetical protein